MSNANLASNGTTATTATSTAMHIPRKRQKLSGRAFYEYLGSPKMVLAPMVDQSEFAWRLLTRSYMPPEASKDLLAYTPMIHSRLFLQTPKFREQHFQPTRLGSSSHTPSVPNETTQEAYLDGNPSLDRPLFVQFCANSPDELLEAAKHVEPYCDAVDLNLGCPQGIARRGNYGAFLQEDWNLIYKLVNKLHENLGVPVTAKMRILETKEKTLEYAKMILSAGASIITVHGRNRDQKGHKTGLADWSVLRYLRTNLPPDTVIFANGNILRHEDIHKCLEETGADGVMSAEGNLYDPTIFAKPPEVGEESREYWRGRDGKSGYRMDAVFRRYMDIIYKHVLEQEPPQRSPLFLPSGLDLKDDWISLNNGNDEAEQPSPKRQKGDEKPKRATSPNLVAMQAHLFHLLRPLVSNHTNIRDALARSRAGDIPAFENVLQLVEQAVKEGLLDYDADPTRYEKADSPTSEELKDSADKEKSSVAAVKACRRPWWVCQPYVRPLPKEALENGSLTMSKKDKKRLEEESELGKAMTERGTQSKREDAAQGAGVSEQEMPAQAMVCG